jgi:AcrR family transcriptional regulator
MEELSMARCNAKEIFAESIIDLLCKKPLQKITVANIVGHSGLSRQSFYVYYQDKYDLVNQIYDDDINRAIQNLQSHGIFMDLRIEAVFDGMCDKLQFYAKAFEYSGENSLISHMKKISYQAHSDILQSFIGSGILEQKMQYCLNFHANCITAACVEWINSGARLPTSDVVSIIIDSIPRMMRAHYIFSKH